jgi:transcriptional regulator with XRE-family HTH domain
MSLKDTLKELRTSHDISQETLAKMVGTKRANVGNWETGRVSPDFDMLKKLFYFYNVTTDYLLGNSQTPQTENRLVIVTKEDVELLKSYKLLSEENQTLVKNLIGNLSK